MQSHNTRTVCFVDDDPAALARFESAFGEDFRVVTAGTYTDAITKLKAAGLRSPHLWVLDLYFPVSGRTNTPEELHDMSARFEAFDRARQDFVTYLCSIGQGREGGLELLARCRKNHRRPAVMLTRKGTIDDAIACFSAGAAEVLKKPMPRALPGDKDARAKALDDALIQGKADLVDRFEAQIARNTHWVKYRGQYLAVATFFLGLLADRAMGWIGL